MAIPVSRPFEVPEPVFVPKQTFNIKIVTAQLTNILTDELKALITDAEGDLGLLAQEIAPVLVSAVASGDKVLTDELKAQLEGIAEIYKIKSNAAAWRVVQSVSSVLLQALQIGVGIVIKAI